MNRKQNTESVQGNQSNQNGQPTKNYRSRHKQQKKQNKNQKLKQFKPMLKQLFFFIIIGATATVLTRYSILDFLKHYLVYMNIVFTFLLPIIIILINKIRGRTVSQSESDTSS